MAAVTLLSQGSEAVCLQGLIHTLLVLFLESLVLRGFLVVPDLGVSGKQDFEPDSFIQQSCS